MQLTDRVKVEIRDGIEPVTGAATYRRIEYSLVYKSTTGLSELNAKRSAGGAWRQSGLRVFVTSGFVTLAFDGIPYVFTGLEAYANDARWVEQDIPFSIPRTRGALVLTDDRLDDDRLSIGAAPAFAIDRRRATIRIGFAQGSETYFEVGTGLLAGISDDRLTSLILSAVRFE